MSIIVRRSEPSDAKGIKEVYECTNAYTGTLQLPNPSLESWQKRISKIPDNVYSYVAMIDDEIVGNLGMEVCVNPRRRHVASFGMGVKDDVLGKGVGSQLLATAIDLCDNWINIKRLELTVYTDNERAISLYKKFGFVIEGVDEIPAEDKIKHLRLSQVWPCDGVGRQRFQIPQAPHEGCTGCPQAGHGARGHAGQLSQQIHGLPFA